LSEQDPARIASIAEAIKHAISAPITFAKREIVLTASIGLITWTSDQASAADLVKDAELAMHQAKRFGGDRIEPFRPAFRHRRAPTRLQFESDLRRAIERREFHPLPYQPIVRLEDNSIAGFEALLRWDHPRRGMTPAGRLHPGGGKLRTDRPARPVRHAASGRRPCAMAEAVRRDAVFRCPSTCRAASSFAATWSATCARSSRAPI
jgi:FOG: EAL domain